MRVLNRTVCQQQLAAYSSSAPFVRGLELCAGDLEDGGVGTTRITFYY